MKLTVRDFLWLTLLVAGVTMWVLEWRRCRRMAKSHLHSILRSIRQHPSEYEPQRRQAQAGFQSMSNEQLDDYLWELRCCGPWEKWRVEYEPCLLEMARRNMVSELADHYGSLMATFAGKSPLEHPHNFEMLTALRRAECQPDPLTVTLGVHSAEPLPDEGSSVPVSVQLQNTDMGQESIMLWHAGRSRYQRTFTLTDVDSREVLSLHESMFSISSVFYYGPVYAGQQQARDLFDLQHYLKAPTPGRYYLQAIYHDDPSTRPNDFETRIVIKSEPVLVEVTHSDDGRLLVAASTPPPLAVFLACVVMVLTSARRSARPSPSLLSYGISRRDFRWGLLLIFVGLAMWGTLPDTQDYAPPLNASENWSIKRVE